MLHISSLANVTLIMMIDYWKGLGTHFYGQVLDRIQNQAQTGNNLVTWTSSVRQEQD